MVKLGLEALRGDPEIFDVHHINARFSETLEDVGESNLRKAIPITAYLLRAIRLRFQLSSPLLYYVPGPAKWSAVLRDWVIVGILRLFYPKIIFHWHAIGHGEWAHGSDRMTLEGPAWLDRIARRISSLVLNKPYASIAVSPTSAKDSVAVSSIHQLTVCNGIEDPCPDFDQRLACLRKSEQANLVSAENPVFRILYLSHGTIQKGLTDALEALGILMRNSNPSWRFQVTFAGGVNEVLQIRFNHDVEALLKGAGERLEVVIEKYVVGSEKNRCYEEHDIFLAPSRWESFGLTVLEAMAHGMRIVATASDGVSGVLPEDHPYLSAVGDPASLAHSLGRCCRDLTEGREMDQGEALRRRFLELYQIRFFSGNLKQAIASLGRQARHGEESIFAPQESTSTQSFGKRDLSIQVYLADQNPGHDRSFGISRMSQVVLHSLSRTGQVTISATVSKTSQQAPQGTDFTRTLPWGTRRKLVRLLTDHFHPLFSQSGASPSLHYFPKGYLPCLSSLCKPSVVTIHDTIIQYDEDHYPEWRKAWEYAYWAMILKHTLRKADRILTVSESSKRQIHEFMARHEIPHKNITVTYEPCLYETLPQPEAPVKENYVIHLASCEPHKRTSHLVRWWSEAEAKNRNLPMLHLIGTVPPDVAPLLSTSRSIMKRPFLEDSALQAAYLGAKALILPSEIEGFGLPALEAYYLGTPVCFVNGTSVEEILTVATKKGGFSLDSATSLHGALDEVMAMTPAEVRDCGLTLRQAYASSKVAERMLSVFREISAN